MRTLVKRINKVETAMQLRASDLSRLTDEELENRVDAVLVRLGTTQERAIAVHGSLNAFADMLSKRENQHGTA